MATEYGSLPFPEAIEYLRRKIDLPTEHWDDILGAAHDRYFMVAGAAKADLLADLHEAVRKGIEDGTTLEEFRRDFDKLVYKNGWTGFTGEDTPGGLAWRTNVIYSTNLRTAYQAGRFAQHREGAADRPYLQYNHSDGVEHPRPLHQSWDGTILAASDPWWDTHYTPNGWGCRCYVTSLASRDLERLGKDGPDPTPDDGTYIHKDRNGVAHELPAGVDYGWAHAPGQTRDLVRELEAKAAKLPGQIGEDLKADLVAPAPVVGPGWHEPIPTDVDTVLARGRAREAELFGASAKNMDKLADKLKRLEDDVDAKFWALFADDPEGRRLQDHADAGEAYDKAKKAGVNAMARLQKAMQAKVSEREALMRAQGLAVPSAKDKAATLRIGDYAGEDLKELRKNAESFYRQFGATADTVKAVGNWRDRAYCSETLDDFHTVNMGTSAKSAQVLFHEFGHSVEFTNKTAATARAWYMRRATGPSVPLRDLTKNPNYEADEMAYPGPFFDAYVAKDYGDSVTEVMSMGLQNFIDPGNLLSFWLKDREHFRLVLGLLAL